MTIRCIVSLLLLLSLLASDLVKGSNYSPEQLFYDQHSRTSNPFNTAATINSNNKQPTQSAFSRFIIGQYTLPPNVIKITERIAVKVPYAQLIPVPHNVPFPFAVPISKPFPVEVPQFNLNDSTENSPHWPHHVDDQSVKSFENVPSTAYDGHQNYGLEISRELLPPT